MLIEMQVQMTQTKLKLQINKKLYFFFSFLQCPPTVAEECKRWCYYRVNRTTNTASRVFSSFFCRIWTTNIRTPNRSI